MPMKTTTPPMTRILLLLLAVIVYHQQLSFAAAFVVPAQLLAVPPTSAAKKKKKNAVSSVCLSFSSSSSSTSNTKQQQYTGNSNKHPSLSPFTLESVGDLVGSGSYGTVHQVAIQQQQQVQVHDDDNNTNNDDSSSSFTTTTIAIAKRSWTLEELQDKLSAENVSQAELQEKHKRCLMYFATEVHCLEKLSSNNNNKQQQQQQQQQQQRNTFVPKYRGMASKQNNNNNKVDEHSWMVVDLIAASDSSDNDNDKTNSIVPAPSLADVLQLETQTRHPHDHHLSQVSLAMNLNTKSSSSASSSSSSSLLETLDVVFQQLLQALAYIHSHSIVHRDIKPSNILVSSSTINNNSQQQAVLTLIDFGSAADLSTHGWNQANIGLQDYNSVTISPLYAAPEVFVDPANTRNALTFDVFSMALLYCQLLFQYTDERTEAGFRQQLQAAHWNMNTWLQAQLQSKVAPVGLLEALEVLRERPGLWALLQSMLEVDPKRRISSSDALHWWTTKIATKQEDTLVDGAFLKDVLESMEYCDVRPSIRPLHFVATFAKGESLGLVLSEAIQIDDADKEEEKGEEWDVASKTKWQQATSDALPGEVFVKGIVSGGQAEEMNVFEIGDRLQGVGELVVGQGGFETVVAMLQDQPKASKYVTLHFDRKSALIDRPSESIESSVPVQSIDAGAWSVTGRRAAQEDAFVLSEVYDEAGKRSVRLAGIMDGHLGAAASNFVRDAIAETLSEEMMKASADAPMDELLQQSWNRICINYRQSCEDDASCSAEFDPLEGVLQAFTGGENAVAGTTAVIMALDMQSSIVSVLNCGDSRGIIVDKTGKVRFVTNDHSPGTETEMERFEKGISEGLLYELPECILSKWIVPVGDYNYAVSRSLEGSFATSRGVISTPDISRVPIDAGMTLILASDGLWEVIDSQQVSSILYKLRYDQKETASDAAKILTSLALEKGSADNVSVVVMYVQ